MIPSIQGTVQDMKVDICWIFYIHPGDFKTAAPVMVAWMSFNWVPLWNKRAAWVTPREEFVMNKFSRVGRTRAAVCHSRIQILTETAFLRFF